MNPLEFEEIIKDLNKEKYHINRMLQFNENNIPYLSEWSIFRKDIPDIDFFADDNKAVLSSRNGDTIEDIKKLIEKEKES